MYFNCSTETTKAHLHWLGLGVRDLVEAKWDEITTIAEALQEHGSLDRKAIRTIMHPPPVPSGKGANLSGLHVYPAGYKPPGWGAGVRNPTKV